MAAYRQAVRGVSVAVLLAAMAVLSSGCAQELQAQVTDDVGVAVRASPLQASLTVVPTRVRAGQLVVAISEISNRSGAPVTILDPKLGFQQGAFSMLLHVGSKHGTIRPHRRRIDLWVLRARSSGSFVLVASAAAVTSSGVGFTVESNGEVLVVRPR